MHTLGNPRKHWRVSKKQADLSYLGPAPKILSMNAEPQHVSIDLARTCHIIIDMQNDFCTAQGWLDYIGVDYTPARKPIDPLNQVNQSLHEANVPILWLNWGNRQDQLNLNPSVLHVYNPAGDDVGLGGPLPSNQSKVLEKGSWGAAIVDELDVHETDIHVDKYRMSGFWDTPLDSILRNLGIDTLLFSGVNLDQCVLHTLSDAVCLGYNSILVEDCSATSSPLFCEQATLYNIKQCYGFVTQSEHLLKAMY